MCNGAAGKSDTNADCAIIFWTFAGEFANKLTGKKVYEWLENSWEETGTTTYYYSSITTQTNIPNISANTLSIFPNPVAESFTISGITENTLVTISDLNGRIVLQKTVSPNESVFVNYLSVGVYLVCVNEYAVKMVKR